MISSFILTVIGININGLKILCPHIQVILVEVGGEIEVAPTLEERAHGFDYLPTSQYNYNSGCQNYCHH